VPTSPSPPGYGGYEHGGYDRGAGRGGADRGRPPGGGPPALVGKRRRPRWRKVLLITALTLLLLVGLGAGGLYLYARGLEGNMERIEVFSQIPGERPAGSGGALNVLMLGSDSRDPDAPDGDAYRADTIMLLHVPSSQDEAFLISIPRDLWVYVPPSADGTAGDQEAKINAATAFGGIPLAVMTVENYTGLLIDHVMLIDFGGFVEVTDALGGVDMNIEQTITSIHGDRRVFEEGRQHLNGEEALDYIRQRYQFADGDFTRMRNQQQFLKALMDKAASTGTLSNPGKLNAFLQTATSTMTVDEDFSLIDVGWKFRGLRSDNLTFLTSPNAGTGSVGDQSVVFSDDEAAAEFYTALREDRAAQWVAENPDAVR
jgi:LCP family protein required for cell wall assembly